jgi:uncharacterized protein
MNYYLALTITGLLSGGVAGLLGAGAEILVVPLLTLFGVLGSLKNRIGTSLFMLLPPIGLFAAIEFYKDGYVDIFAGLYMAVIFTIFSYFSSRYIKKIDTNLLRKVFGVFTVFSGIYIFYTKHD